jgi:hypothetical protein
MFSHIATIIGTDTRNNSHGRNSCTNTIYSAFVLMRMSCRVVLRREAMINRMRRLESLAMTCYTVYNYDKEKTYKINNLTKLKGHKNMSG